MVQYWKFKEHCAAKVTKTNEGSIIMKMEGEKYPFPTFPRGHLLFGYLSKLKHEIKNQVFNISWHMLEHNYNKEFVIKYIKRKLQVDIRAIAEPLKYDVLPERAMCPSVKEIMRAWKVVSPETKSIRDYLCLILQEDDAYRFRVQLLAEWYGYNGWLMKRNPVKYFKKSLEMAEHMEVIGDMKERIRLLRRILLLVLEDKNIRDKFEKLFREINWSKVKMTKGDKYHARGKYIKCDYRLFDY